MHTYVLSIANDTLISDLVHHDIHSTLLHRYIGLGKVLTEPTLSCAFLDEKYGRRRR